MNAEVAMEESTARTQSDDIRAAEEIGKSREEIVAEVGKVIVVRRR